MVYCSMLAKLPSVWAYGQVDGLKNRNIIGKEYTHINMTKLHVFSIPIFVLR